MTAYPTSVYQPMQVRFDIRKARIKKLNHTGSFDAQSGYDCSVEVTIYINETRYGRYATGIRTFKAIWDGRKAARVSAASKALILQLASFQHTIEAAYWELTQEGRSVDGQAVLNAVLRPMSKGDKLLMVYEEFMVARKASVEVCRQKRNYDQISIATLKSYPKRWAMIQLFLEQRKRSQLPVSCVDYALTTQLKEFLVAYRQGSKQVYSSATINKAISFLKMLMTYAQSKSYVQTNPISTFACRGGSTANPKPLTVEQLDQLEHCLLPLKLRHICDSWLVAGELCLHYSDYVQLPSVQFVTQPDGRRYILHERSKQQGSKLKQTVDITPRAERLLAKYGGPAGLYYKSSAQFSAELKKIAMLADLVDERNIPIMLQFGQGRDSGLTQRARMGANGIQLSKMAGWANPRVANRYIGDDLGIVEAFVKSTQTNEPEPIPTSSQPFIRIHKTA